jgi:hypothetical protein
VLALALAGLLRLRLFLEQEVMDDPANRGRPARLHDVVGAHRHFREEFGTYKRRAAPSWGLRGKRNIVVTGGNYPFAQIQFAPSAFDHCLRAGRRQCD